MARNFFISVLFLPLFLSYVAKQDSSEIIGTWILKYSESNPLNIYGIADDLPDQTVFNFKADNIIVVESPKSKTVWTIDYKLARDTVATLRMDSDTVASDAKSVLFMGKDEFMPGYIIKQHSKDSLVLIAYYKKAMLELPRPNQFGTNTEQFKEYEIVMTRK